MSKYFHSEFYQNYAG